MPKVATPTPEQREWQEAHRCVICNGLPVRIESNLVDEYRTLKPEYRHLAAFGIPAESWHTDYVGGEWSVEVECENGHLFRARDWRFR